MTSRDNPPTSGPRSPGPRSPALRPAGLLARLARLNLTGVFVAVAVFTLVALLAPGIVGGAFLLALAAALIALMSVTWAITAPKTRAIRLAMLTLLVAAALVKIL